MTDGRTHAAAGPGGPDRFPAPLVETEVVLPRGVDDVLGGPAPAPPERWLVEAPALPWTIQGWGNGRPVLLLHGVTSSGSSWWRIAPALAAAGYTAIAPDMPGHGETPAPASVSSSGRLPPDVVAGLVAELVDELGLPAAELSVAGHSWGAIVAASLPAAGLRLRRLVLLDPPVRDAAWAAEQAATLHRPAGREEALAMALERIPTGSVEDVGVRADALLQLDPGTARAVFRSTPWDGAVGALAGPMGPVAAGIPTWVIRGDPRAGAYLPDDALPRLAELVGPSHLLTVAGGEHSFTRGRPRATLAALLDAIR